MISVCFITANNEKVNAQATPGQRLLEVGQAAGLPLEGTCEGQMACSTCHVIVAQEWFARLIPATENEDDMLDLAAGVTRTSRLSCQILLTAELDGLVVHVPGEARDQQRF